MDVDFINNKDLEKLFKGLESLENKVIYWHDTTAFVFEDRLHVLVGERKLNKHMCDFTLYFEHPVHQPCSLGDNVIQEDVSGDDFVAEEVVSIDDPLGQIDSSSSYDSYQIDNGKAYKPHPLEDESDNSKEFSKSQKRKKKRLLKRYTRAKKKKHVLNGEKKNGDDIEVNTKHDNETDSELYINVRLRDDDVDYSNSEKVYDYKFEDFDTSMFSDEKKGLIGPDFNKDTAYRDVKFEFGMQFATMELFKKVLKNVLFRKKRTACISKMNPRRKSQDHMYKGELSLAS
ncbi:uncharacterized protein DS421_14g483200 [Arachis hypogaea]|nr:uncharacterized protein DS421_14g483200 [Arachis hypogaea]